MTNKIPFIDLKTQYAVLKAAIDARIQTVLDHGQYIMGPEVKELEARLGESCGTRHCVTVASGTEALLISLMALDIRPGDEVITTPFTFIATGEVIALLGAKPVFVDIQPDTFNIDPEAVEAAITPRTRAIIPVSLYGQPADMDEICMIADRHGSISVIEDAAQSFGATYKGRRSCQLSPIACTSFFPSKPLGCYGDGGAIFTDDAELAQAMREIRVHGQARRYHHTRIGVGGRMDTLQCAIVLAKLDRFDWEVQRRQDLGARYSELIGDTCDGVRVPAIRADRTSVFAQYTIEVDGRDAVAAALAELGVPTAVHYPKPLHRQPAFQNICRAHDCSVSDSKAAAVMSLPMGPYLTDDDQQRIVRAVRRATSGGPSQR